MPAASLIVAPLTPFASDLTLDEPALRRQIDYVVEDCGATMVVAAGVETQEYGYLGLEQRKRLIRCTIELVDRRVPVLAGVSHASFKTAIELAHDAERCGAAAVHARYCTTMQMLLITLLLGGSGATMPPPAAEIARHIIDAWRAQEYQRAAELQLQFALFPSRWMHRGLAPVMKAAMSLIGVSV